MVQDAACGQGRCVHNGRARSEGTLHGAGPGGAERVATKVATVGGLMAEPAEGRAPAWKDTVF